MGHDLGSVPNSAFIEVLAVRSDNHETFRIDGDIISKLQAAEERWNKVENDEIAQLMGALKQDKG